MASPAPKAANGTEKGPLSVDNASSQPDIEQGDIKDSSHRISAVGRKSSVAGSVIAGDLLDDRYAITKRGLKSRHAQMIALGGTIGTG